jgi:oligoendopeptidase F
VRFDLSPLYAGFDDPRVQSDLEALETRYRDFSSKYRGNLSTSLGDAIAAYNNIELLQNRLGVFFALARSCDVTDQAIEQAESRVDERVAKLAAEHTEFFSVEVGKLSEVEYQEQISGHPTVAFHKPALDQIRQNAKYQLSEDVESALTLRAPFGPAAIIDFYSTVTTNARYRLSPENVPGLTDRPELCVPLTEAKILDVISNDKDRAIRAEALRAFNEGLTTQIVPIMTASLNAVAGSRGVDTKARGFTQPISARNISNRVSDGVVDALHEAVRTEGAQLAQRYYRLLARHLKVPRLLWSDRNAKVGTQKTTVPWQEAVATVNEAFASFSPTMAKHFGTLLSNRFIDAPHYPSKRPGAFNISSVIEGLGPCSFVLLNYRGSLRDVQTLAHEAGHAVHGYLAGEAQGVMMQGAPTAYAETASIFAEMVTFDLLLKRCSTSEERLAMLMDRCGGFLNTVVRQISFSTFEQRLHAARVDGKLTSQNFDDIWIDVTKQFYGADGDVFDFKDTKSLWSYINHFHRPFYVYGYAFGELLTQSLFAQKEKFGDRFEPLYLDLLRAGGTKDAVELLAPFGLNPEDPSFWVDGLRASMARWLDEAERLSESGRPNL